MAWRASAESICACTRSALAMARDLGYESIAFPVLGSGSGGFSEDDAASLITDVLSAEAIDLTTRLVRFRA
ncbi:MAG: macro domain-containing protein, partial [Myxococcota bacterium]